MGVRPRSKLNRWSAGSDVYKRQLNAMGAGLANYANILIKPTGGASRVISGAITAGNPLIDLNGADNVTFDGLNSGGNALTIDNTTISPTSGTSTIRLQADATNNTFIRCNINGASTMAVGTNGGNFWFGASSTIAGNDNNLISNCKIGPSGVNFPTKGVYSLSLIHISEPTRPY
mgnify:CR=1 FL=1